jgi:hypothetical protein
MSSLRLAKLTQLMKEAQKQQIVTKNFGQRVDLYTNFNLLNDMKDSIYVEQEGRTVGDVEVLPGKTLSGCLTNSNLTVHFTNLMGGKDSKVIDSNELRTLIPSLTVKAGELSPTLNVSKVLIDISIKKFNSVNKLAEMRKIAATFEDTKAEWAKIDKEISPITEEMLDTDYVYGDSGGDMDDIDSAAKQRITDFVRNNIFAKSLTLQNLYTKISEEFKAKKLKPPPSEKTTSFGSDIKEFFNQYKPIQDKWIKIVEDKKLPLTEVAGNSAATTQIDDKGRAQPTQKANSSGAVAKTYADVIKQELWTKTVRDNAGYTFEIGADGKSLTYSKDGSVPKTLNQSYKNWPQLVKNINELTPVAGSDSAATAGTATDTQPATAPAAKTEEAKPAEATRQFDPSTLAGVKAVLIRAAKPGGFGLSVGTAANERRRIQKMIETISSSEGPSIDAYDFLTKMLLVSPRGDTYLTAFFRGASQDDIDAIMRSPRKDVVADPKGGKYNRQVAAVLSVLNEVYDGDFSEDNTKAIKDFKAKYVKASKLNNSIIKISSKVDPKIKKLATLRRLRVRSQMEEATESATRFGRSRIS